MRVRPALLALTGVLAAGSAQAAGIGSGSGPSEVVLIVQIVLLLAVGRLLGEAMLRVGQPAVMGQLLAGLLLGPSVLGAVWPEAQHWLFPPGRDQKALLDGIAQLGILLLLLMTGLETDLALVRRVRRAAVSVSVTGVAVPFGCGFLLGQFLPEAMLPHPELRLVTALFLGTALAISSVKIVAMVVREMNFLRRNVGQVIVASAIIDDTIGWVIIAVIFSLAQAGTLDPWAIGRSLAGTLVFLGLSLTVGRSLVFRLIRWANDSLRSEAAVITAIL
ncbi:cation:proton antiporter, partial [Methylobacterium aquaticum]